MSTKPQNRLKSGTYWPRGEQTNDQRLRPGIYSRDGSILVAQGASGTDLSVSDRLLSVDMSSDDYVTVTAYGNILLPYFGSARLINQTLQFVRPTGTSSRTINLFLRLDIQETVSGSGSMSVYFNDWETSNPWGDATGTNNANRPELYSPLYSGQEVPYMVRLASIQVYPEPSDQDHVSYWFRDMAFIFMPTPVIWYSQSTQLLYAIDGTTPVAITPGSTHTIGWKTSTVGTVPYILGLDTDLEIEVGQITTDSNGTPTSFKNIQRAHPDELRLTSGIDGSIVVGANTYWFKHGMLQQVT